MADKSDIYGQIAELYKSKEYMAICSYYDQKNIFEILKVARDEDVHSNFLAWLLNPVESHGYGTFPLRQFLRLIALAAKTYPCNKEIPVADIDAQFLDKLLIGTKTVTSVSIEREKWTSSNSQKKKRMDLVLEVRFNDDDKTLPVIIENKVKSDEHGDDKDKQSNYYYEWAKKKYVKSAEPARYEKPLFVFLSPKYDTKSLATEIRKNICANDSYILISYQDIMEHLLEPCKEQDGSEYARSLVKDYMRCLSDSEKGDTMATENETKELLRKFWKRNEELFLKIIDALAMDDDKTISDDVKVAMENLVTSSKDFTQYTFNNEKYGKGRLVHAIVKRYVEDNPNITLDELLKNFPEKLQGKYGVFTESSQATDKNYFCKDNEIIPLNNSGTTVAVCRQWGISNIDGFIDHATKELGYTIEKSK